MTDSLDRDRSGDGVPVVAPQASSMRVAIAIVLGLALMAPAFVARCPRACKKQLTSEFRTRKSACAGGTSRKACRKKCRATRNADTRTQVERRCEAAVVRASGHRHPHDLDDDSCRHIDHDGSAHEHDGSVHHDDDRHLCRRAGRDGVQRRQRVHDRGRLPGRKVHRSGSRHLRVPGPVPERRKLRPCNRSVLVPGEGQRHNVQRRQRVHGRRCLPGGELCQWFWHHLSDPLLPAPVPPAGAGL